MPRKSLPRSNKRSVNAVKQQRTGLTASWRLQGLWEPGQQDAAVQVISEEEQKKLAQLELDMRLPRVAGKIDSWLLIIVLALLCIGLVMVYSSSAFMAARTYGDASYFFQKQLLSVILGIIVMLVTMRVDYRQWRRFSLAGMVIILPLLVIVLRFGHVAFGASRWLTFGSFFSIQPRRNHQIDTGTLYRGLAGAQGEAGWHISLWPGTICDPGRSGVGTGSARKRYGHGYYNRRFRDGYVLYGRGQYSAISASNGLWRVNILTRGI